MAAPSRDREAVEQAVVRGSELLKQGAFEQARRAFRAALELDPDNPRVLALLGLTHFRANEFSEARVLYELLVERAPTDASHRLNLGLVYLKLNDADQAIAALEASRALDPSQGRAVSYLGLAYARGGRYAEAYRAFLIAGQNDLATEIETNLSDYERDRIHHQLGRTPQGPLDPSAASASQSGAATTTGSSTAAAATSGGASASAATSAGYAGNAGPVAAAAGVTFARATTASGVSVSPPRAQTQPGLRAAQPTPGNAIPVVRTPDAAASAPTTGPLAGATRAPTQTIPAASAPVAPQPRAPTQSIPVARPPTQSMPAVSAAPAAPARAPTQTIPAQPRTPTPTGTPATRARTLTPTGLPETRPRTPTPTGLVEPRARTRTPTGLPISDGRTPTPTGVPISGGRTPTPTGLPISGGRTPTPTGLPISGGRTPTPTGVPISGGRTPTPSGLPRTAPPSSPPRARTSPDFVFDGSELAPPADPHVIREISDPRDATRGGVNGPALPAQRGRESPLPIDGTVHIEASAPTGVATLTGPNRPRAFTESMQFVNPISEASLPVEPQDGISMISRAVASATPLSTPGIRTKAGGVPARPLSELATIELVRPDEGDEPFEISANGALIIRVHDRVMTRLDGVHITGGDLSYELAMRRSRGHNTDEAFDHGGSQLHTVSGRGYLIAVPGKHAFSAVSLDDDILYLREDIVFAFQASLRWENGNVPGLRGKLPVVQFRGDGVLAMRLTRPLVRVKLPPQGTVFVDAERLAGWVGRVIPRAVVPPPGGPLGTTCVECTGEGIVLIEPAPDPSELAHRADVRAARSAGPPTPPPEPSRRAPTADPVSGDRDRPFAPPPVENVAAADILSAEDALDRFDEL